MIGKTNGKYKPDPYKLVTWGGGTIQEISDMLNAHYSGKINISDYWAVGDSRSVELSSMGQSTPLHAQPAQTAELIILGFNHDDLTTQINGKTKAAITVQTKGCLKGDGGFNSTGRYDTGLVWSTSDAYYWCNNLFTNMLPSDIKSLVKSVTKQSNRYAYSDYSRYRNQISSDDNIFFVSMFEVFGEKIFDESTWGTLGTLNPDGTQYEYMKTQSNRIKEVPNNGKLIWMTRTVALVSSNVFHVVIVDTDGTGSNSNVANTTHGIAPAFCL